MAGLVIRYRQGGSIRVKAYEWTPETRDLERALLKIKDSPGFNGIVAYEDYDDALARGELFVF